jgi:CO/xanthine dehydrogenase Mo-binding subunit
MHGTGSFASRSAVLAGGATVLAARALNEMIVDASPRRRGVTRGA